MKFAKFLRPPVLKNISCSCFHSFGKISVNLSVPMKLLLYKRGRERERVYCTRDSNFLNNLIYLLTFFTFIYIYKLNFLAFLLPAVNCYHKELHLGCCSSPRSASGNFQVIFTVIFTLNVWLIWRVPFNFIKSDLLRLK